MSFVTVIHRPDLSEAEQAYILADVPGTLVARIHHWRLEHAEPLSFEVREQLCERLYCDVNTLPPGFDSRHVRLVLSDMDSTLINIECIDEIGDFLGIKPKIAAITEAAMRGEIDFETSLTRRVGLLAGVEATALDEIYRQRLSPNPGAETLIAGLRRHGIRFALVSGGFTFFTERLKERLGLDYTRANTLEVENGRLTGRVLGGIVGAAAKAEFLHELCAQLGIRPAQVVAVGDGANDLLMMRAAGLGVAYRAKPAVQAEAATALNRSGLDAILDLLDIDRG